MKNCPYCDWENEDNASKCLACGTELEVNDAEQESVEAETISADMVFQEELYGVGIYAPDNKIAAIKVIKEHFNCGLVEAKNRCENGLVEVGLDKVSAEILADKLRATGATVKILTSKEVEEFNETMTVAKDVVKDMMKTSPKTKLITALIVAACLIIPIVAIILIIAL